jgi:Phytochelatin synthase
VQDGVTLAQAACLASCNGVNVSLAHHGTFTYEAFKAAVLRATATDTEHIVASYSRKGLQQTGDGHFSPIGGYHPEREQVLILDVARFKYPPHWVPLRTLFNAMAAVDATTGACLLRFVCCCEHRGTTVDIVCAVYNRGKQSLSWWLAPAPVCFKRPAA